MPQLKTVSLPYAIDIHTHYNHGSPYDHPVNEMYCGTPEFLREEYDAARVALGCYSSFASVTKAENAPNIPAENRLTAKLAKTMPWFFYWVVLHPEIPETFAQAEAMLSDPKCLGIKIHPSDHEYTLEAYGDRIFSFANQQNAVVLMHPTEMDAICPLADRYPNCKIIVAHLGGVETVDCIERAIHQNVYTDTSGQASKQNNVVEYAVSRVGSRHILFGTDTYSCGFQRGRIQFSRLSETDKENILFRNALRLFPKLREAYETFCGK